MADSASFAERRTRLRIEIIAVVDCNDGASTDRAVAYDLSQDGCMLQFAKKFGQAGDAIVMRWPGGVLLDGRVLWRKNLNAGVQFLSSPPESLLQHFSQGTPSADPEKTSSRAKPQSTHRSRLTPRRPFDPPP
jgi:hypothetical protein